MLPRWCGSTPSPVQLQVTDSAVLSTASCYHCGLPAVFAQRAQVQGQMRDFCCIGCRAVSEAISAGGLGDFYRFREQDSVKPGSAGDFTVYDQAAVQGDFVSDGDNGLRQARLYINGITCAACVWLLEGYLLKLPGVKALRVNASSHQATLAFDPDRVRLSEVFQRFADIGFQAAPLLAQTQRDAWLKQRKEDLLRLGVAGIGMMQAGMMSMGLHAGEIQGIESNWQYLLRWACLILTLPVLLYSAQPFFTASLRALRTRHLVMDVPVSLALILAFAASAAATVSGTGDVYFDSVGMFTFFLLLGRYLEKQTRFRNLMASARQAQLLPLTAEVEDEQGARTVAVKQLVPGDRVRVAAGATFPCDGVLLEGHTEVTEAVITGEALPLQKQPGDAVIAGSMNGSAPVLLQASAVGEGTRLAAIEGLIEQSELRRPRQVALADKLAAKFVARVLVISVITYLFWYFYQPSRALWVTLSVLVVTCPCALSLATPTVLTAAVNRLRRLGILVTGDQTLETLTKVNHVVFDKTGTLTEGQLHLAEVRLLGSQTREEVLTVAAALEEGSAHPIARAFVDYAVGLPVQERNVSLGQGVAGRIDGSVYRLGTPAFALGGADQPAYPCAGLWLLLSCNNRPCAWVRLQDRLRPCAAEAVATLKAGGMAVTLLSGDRRENVAGIADQLGIADWHSDLLPEQKLDRLAALQSGGARVFMIGDGINDVPVLAAADVSCAMGSGTELAQTKADCVLINEDLRHLPRLLSIAQRTRQIVRQNLTWTLIYNITALPLAMAGLVPPWLAAIGMSASSLVVVLNALRVGRTRLPVSASGPTGLQEVYP